MKKILIPFALCLAFTLSQPLAAAVCDLEPVPAATLLLPYFEVGDEVTTLFSINNASPEPTLVLVTLWTDWGVPTVWFHVYLTGFDVARINLADIFEGNIPITADEQNDPDDTVSPSGGPFLGRTVPEWEGSFPDCDKFFPFFENPVIAGTALERMVEGHTGQPVAAVGGQCLGADHGDRVVRGFVTVDSVNRCSLTFMDAPEFFAAEGGIANGRNVLWGDFFLVDADHRYAEGSNLVHIEAVESLDEIPTGATFYGRFATGGADLREPLGTVWASPYLANDSVNGHTDLLVWRDPTVRDLLPDGAECGDSGTLNAGPSWFPLNETEVVAFNESEDAVALCRNLGGVIPVGEAETYCFPYASGRYRWNDGLLATPFSFGWAWLNLNLPEAAAGVASQSHVTSLHRAPGFFSVGVPALRLEGACGDANPSLRDEWSIPYF